MPFPTSPADRRILLRYRHAYLGLGLAEDLRQKIAQIFNLIPIRVEVVYDPLLDELHVMEMDNRYFHKQDWDSNPKGQALLAQFANCLEVHGICRAPLGFDATSALESTSPSIEVPEAPPEADPVPKVLIPAAKNRASGRDFRPHGNPGRNHNPARVHVGSRSLVMS